MTLAKEFPKSERARRGRKWQFIGEQKVKKFAYSPWTTKAHVRYAFFADIVLKKAIESPPGVETKRITVELMDGEGKEFRRFCRSGEVFNRIAEIVEGKGAEVAEIEGYWRNIGEPEYVD